MLNFEVLGSSSSGNCYLIRTSKETLLLECGVKYKQMIEALNFNLNSVVGCIITHEHGDHSKSINEVIKAGINVYGSAGTFNARSVNNSHRVHIVKAKIQFRVGSFSILPFDIEHDAVEPLGYLIYHPEFGYFLFATDTYYIKYKFQNLNYIALECNYSKEILEERIRAGKLNPVLKKRLLKSHFSLENVKKFLLANDLSGTKEIMLIHLSSGSSHAKNFKNEVERLTGVPVTICQE